MIFGNRQTAADRPKAESVEQSICMDCGMCCDGTLYGNTRVREEDKEPVARLGLTITETAGNATFLQPCPYFCGHCKAYEDRPPVCRGFRCSLLKSVDEGKLGVPQALEKIAKAKALVSAVREIKSDAITPGQRIALSKELQSRLPSSSQEEKAAIGKKLLDIGALDIFLGQWFHKKKDKKADQ